MTDDDQPAGYDQALQDWMVPGIVLAVVDHRRQIATLLSRLDQLHREAAESAVVAFEGGVIDAATLLLQFSDHLRTSDAHLEHALSDLERRRWLRRPFSG